LEVDRKTIRKMREIIACLKYMDEFKRAAGEEQKWIVLGMPKD
jgi:hypothetical protein